jgi:hypothetical protein
MAEYARIQAGTVAELVDLDPATHAAWTAAGNPKAAVYRQVATDPLPPHDPRLQAVEPELVVRPDSVIRAWSVRAKTPDELRQTWTSYEFLARFTASERAAIRSGSMSDAALADFLMFSQAAQEVVSDDPVTAAGMDYLVSLGILTPARRAELLS